MPPCLTFSLISYGSRVKWSKPRKGVGPSLHLGVLAIKKGAFRSPFTIVANFNYYYVTDLFKSQFELVDHQMD